MTIGIIGAGNMASALARGWGEPLLATDGGSGRARALVAELGGEALSSNAELARRADIVVLAHKPAQLQLVADQASADARRVVSLLDGLSVDQIQSAYPDAEVACAMPNVAVALRDGVTVLAADNGDGAFATEVRELFERVGLVVELPDRLMRAASAVAGVMPAYLALIAEAQIDAGIRCGLTAAVAGDLVTASLVGSARLLRERGGADTLAIRREVTSPGGITARGLAALERGGVRSAFASALDAVVGAGK